MLMIPLRQSGFFDRPTIQIILYACLAIYGFRVLLPFALGSREQLAENAESIGTRNPCVARIFCFIAMVAVFVGFLTVLLIPEVNAMVQLSVVLSVVAAGIFSLRKTQAKPQQGNKLATDEHAL